MGTDRYDIERAVLDQVRAADDGSAKALVRGYRLGSSGVRADLAVLADTFIGFAFRSAACPIDDLSRELPVYARCFDRVALVVDPCHIAVVRSVDLGGASLWSVTREGTLAEHVAGRPNRVGVSALVDMLPVEERRRLLRPLVPRRAAYDRDDPPATDAEVRAFFEEVFAAAHGEAAVLLRAA